MQQNLTFLQISRLRTMITTPHWKFTKLEKVLILLTPKRSSGETGQKTTMLKEYKVKLFDILSEIVQSAGDEKFYDYEKKVLDHFHCIFYFSLVVKFISCYFYPIIFSLYNWYLRFSKIHA